MLSLALLLAAPNQQYSRIKLMDKTKSTVVGKSGAAQKAEPTCANAQGATTRRRVNIRMLENVLLIWLDNTIDDNSVDCRNTIGQLRRVVNSINTFTDSDECIQFLESLNNDKACMIISDSVGQDILSHVHNMSQVDSIFIFCDNKKRCGQWTKDWPKIKGVYTEISPICEALKQVVHQCEHNAIPISFMATSGDMSKKKLDQLDCSFMYTQILKEILLTIKFEEKHIKELIDYCREQFVGNDRTLSNINGFEREYRDKLPIWWYTKHSFLYPMLNRVLRTMEVDIIIKMGFFISDLHCDIAQLHNKQFDGRQTNTTFTIYRGQGMSKIDFEQLTKTKGGLLAFNNFLSTSKNREVAFMLADSNKDNPDLVGILFSMTINPSKSTTPFASITDISYFQTEDEVLFSMHTVFRIGNITPIDQNHCLFEVNLTLTSDNDEDLRILTNRIREDTYPDATGWYRLGLLLLQMSKPDKAQQVYEILLEQTTNESEKSPIYHQLGTVKHVQGEYQESIAYYEKSFEIYKKILPPNHLSLANSYNNIGLAYDSMGEYSKALSSYEKALAIQQQSLPNNHSSLSASYTNIGNVYSKMGEYLKARSSYEKALEIKQQSLPPNHPSLAGSYGNIGHVCNDMGEYSKALLSHEKALEIQQQSLPPNHPDFASSYNNIGMVYENMGEYSKALSYYEKDLEISQKTLPPNHPNLGMSYNNIGGVYDYMGDYSKALSSHEKALEIRQQSLPPKHPDLASSYYNIGNVYNDMGDYSKARSYYKRAADIGQDSLPSDHPHLQWYREKLEDVKTKL